MKAIIFILGNNLLVLLIFSLSVYLNFFKFAQSTFTQWKKHLIIKNEGNILFIAFIIDLQKSIVKILGLNLYSFFKNDIKIHIFRIFHLE